MKLKITIEMDNAAFDGGRGEESARILRDLADLMDGSQLFAGNGWILRDTNGNTVGAARVTR